MKSTLLTLSILLALTAPPRAATNAPLAPAVPPPLTPAAHAAPTAPAPAPAPGAPSAATNAAPALTQSPAPAAPLPPGMLRMNFRNAPLELVLDYLSEAAGFTIVLETEVRGRVDVWNNQPVTKDEALNLLNIVLNKNGYAALQNDRILTIVGRDEAKKRNIPVKSGSDPAGIPKSDEIVTQIIPIRYINAAQLTKDLQPLLSEKASLTANEAGNALVLTDSQASIHRMAEIVRALDTSVAGIATIRVFQMRFADAKTVATVIKEVFQPETGGGRGGNNNADPRAAFFARFRGGGGGGGEGGGGGAAASNGRTTAASRVVAVADERSNSLVVSSPDELMATIEDLVKSVDTNVEDIMELRVFRLKHADPNEMAELLAGLFPDETRSNDRNSSGGGSRFSFFGGLDGGGGRRSSGGGGGAAGASGESDRAKKQSRVLAVADARTASVIVSASRDLMKQIEAMITSLDANPAKKQKVFVYSLENADVSEVETVLKALFESQSGRNARSTGTSPNNALTTRSGQSQSSGTGSNRIGGGGGGGGNSGLGGGNGGGIR
ncbi:hypothetical protein LBMAG56_49150 [Verrucomicrobiota bacterium]|nr:hypothetical protein LBMAG56_49150 [Verrucomicrobiota bacterium]